jgi:hypothetical protein
MATIPVEEYQIRYSSNTFSRCIWLKHDGNYVGILFFLPNGAILPHDYFETTYSYAVLHYHLDDFQNVLDMLRNEQPFYLLYKGSGPGFENCIQSSAEPIGENE